MKLSPNELVYEYPYLRLSADALRDRIMLDSYKFRINETSWFHFAIGMHFFAHQVVLRVTELRDYGNAYLGKQEFNLNIIDVILGPGDYSLEIEQPVTSKWHQFAKAMQSKDH